MLPSFLPYTTQWHDGVVDEISMELLLLLVFLPALQVRQIVPDFRFLLAKYYVKFIFIVNYNCRKLQFRNAKLNESKI